MTEIQVNRAKNDEVGKNKKKHAFLEFLHTHLLTHIHIHPYTLIYTHISLTFTRSLLSSIFRKEPHPPENIDFCHLVTGEGRGNGNEKSRRKKGGPMTILSLAKLKIYITK